MLRKEPDHGRFRSIRLVPLAFFVSGAGPSGRRMETGRAPEEARPAAARPDDYRFAAAVTGAAFRGTFSPRFAARYTKLATTAALCFMSSATSRSYVSMFE